MSVNEDKAGIMLECDRNGRIIRVIRDDFKITEGPFPVQTLFALVDRESREKTQRFLDAVQQGHATFGWELNVTCNGTLTGLTVVGGVTADGVVICGSPSRAGLNKMFDEMMKIQNEQVNVLRSTLKSQQSDAATQQQTHRQMLDDFTRLNNELVNTQRELARRNAELANANSKLSSLATTDGLTGLKNHRAFQEELERQFGAANRYGSALSFLILDVDRFKEFNDHFGHPAGDEVLKQLAQILAAETREDAFAARYGGEEFVVVLPNADDQAAINAAERLRHSVESAHWDLCDITVSIGTATMRKDTPSRAALIAEADAALYCAKAGGRNRVCSYSTSADRSSSVLTPASHC